MEADVSDDTSSIVDCNDSYEDEDEWNEVTDLQALGFTAIQITDYRLQIDPTQEGTRFRSQPRLHGPSSNLIITNTN